MTSKIKSIFRNFTRVDREHWIPETFEPSAGFESIRQWQVLSNDQTGFGATPSVLRYEGPNVHSGVEIVVYG